MQRAHIYVHPTGPKGAPGCPEEPRTICDLIAILAETAGAHDLGVKDVSVRGLTIVLPDGPVRVMLGFGKQVPVTDDDLIGEETGWVDRRPESDSFPDIPALLRLYGGEEASCR